MPIKLNVEWTVFYSASPVFATSQSAFTNTSHIYSPIQRPKLSHDLNSEKVSK